MAKELKRRRFVFVGPTTAYATMQACGLVDDHLLWAWDIAALGSPLSAHASARLARAE